MKVRVIVPVTLTIAVAACTNLPRSRDLANPDVAGATLAQQVCSNCHGITGDSVSPNMPKLAAQQHEYLVAELRGFRSHSRQDPAGFEYMWGISRSLTDKQIDELADYYSKQQPPRSSSAVSDSPENARGRALVTGGAPDHGVPPCSSCHGDKVQGNGKFPRLAGQHADYLIKQLTVFQRTNDRPEGAIMKTVAHALTSADIDAAAAYLQSLD